MMLSSSTLRASSFVIPIAFVVAAVHCASISKKVYKREADDCKPDMNAYYRIYFTSVSDVNNTAQLIAVDNGFELQLRKQQQENMSNTDYTSQLWCFVYTRNTEQANEDGVNKRQDIYSIRAYNDSQAISWYTNMNEEKKISLMYWDHKINNYKSDTIEPPLQFRIEKFNAFCILFWQIHDADGGLVHLVKKATGTILQGQEAGEKNRDKAKFTMVIHNTTNPTMLTLPPTTITTRIPVISGPSIAPSAFENKDWLGVPLIVWILIGCWLLFSLIPGITLTIAIFVVLSKTIYNQQSHWSQKGQPVSQQQQSRPRSQYCSSR